MTKILGSLAVLALAVGLLAAPASAAPDPAVQTVQSFYDSLLYAMKNAKSLGVKGRYAKLKPAITQNFDLSAMIRAVVGNRWTSLSAAERKALLAAFTRKTVAEYASNFDGYSGEKFVVEPVPKTRGNAKVVLSKLISGQQTVTFNYRMRESKGKWKIFDIYLAGFVSQLTRMRSEFAATMLTGGAPALTKILNQKADELLKGK